MRVSFASRIVTRVFTLLILTASLATNVPLYATLLAPSSTRPPSISTPVNQEKSATVNDQPSSPRLLALRDRLISGDRTALDKFWNEISKQGAPIIEPVAGSEQDMQVTMLWRATEETRNVFVFRLGDVSKPMARLLDTDLWYKTFRLQKGARFIYQFGINLPDPKTWRGVTQFASVLRNDPLNPLESSEHANELNPYEGWVFSAVELPSAAPQSWW